MQSLNQELKKNTVDGDKVLTVHPEDNMSLAELIKSRYRKNIKINKLKTPEDAASVLIKDIKEFNVNDEDYFDGTKDEQEELKT